MPSARASGTTGQAGRHGQPQVLPGQGHGHPAPRRPHQHPELQQERLVDVLDGLGGFAHGHGQGAQAHGAAPETAAGGLQDGPVDLVEAELVHLEQLQAVAGGLMVDGAVAPHVGVVPHPLEQPVGQARGAPRAPGDLRPARGSSRAPSTPAERRTITSSSATS